MGKIFFSAFSSLNFLISLVVFAVQFCMCVSLFSKVSLIFLIVRRDASFHTEGTIQYMDEYFKNMFKYTKIFKHSKYISNIDVD